MNILHIDSCALGDHSASRQFTSATIARLTTDHAGAQLHYRDLAAAPLSHVSGPLLQVMRKQWDHTLPMHAGLRAEALQSASLLQEFLDADVVVIGAPMYNFSIPSTLKAWLDRLLQAGPDDAAPAQARSGKRVILVTSRGCPMGGQPLEALLDQHEAHLTTVFAYLGIGRVDVERGDAEHDAALRDDPADHAAMRQRALRAA